MLRLIPLAAAALVLAACDANDGNSTSISFGGNSSADDFDMNGVPLYPGSSLSSTNVNGDDTNKDAGKVHVAFTSPATAATVRDWLQQRLIKAGFTLSADGAGLTGKTDDGKPFALRLTDQGANKSSGTIDMGG